MGKHATIGNSQVGHKSTTLKQGAKYYANQRIANAPLMAGPVKTATVTPFTSERAFELLALHLTRKVTRINATARDFRKVNATTFELRIRDAGIMLTVRKVATETFNGWQAVAKRFGSAETTVLAVTEKGSAINANGERAECCAAALNVLTGMLTNRKTAGAVIARNAGTQATAAIKYTTAGTRDITTCTCCGEPIRACFNLN